MEREFKKKKQLKWNIEARKSEKERNRRRKMRKCIHILHQYFGFYLIFIQCIYTFRYWSAIALAQSHFGIAK